MSTGRPNEGEMQIVVAPEKQKPAVPPRHLAVGAGVVGSNALVEYTAPPLEEEQEDLEIKLRRILENVPVRVSNTSGSSAGSGSGDFHQYRQMRRREQDRLTRMDIDYHKRKELAEFNMRREERLKAAEEQTSKKRLKRQKKKERKKQKKTISSNNEQEKKKEGSGNDNGGNSSNDDHDDDDDVVEK